MPCNKIAAATLLVLPARRRRAHDRPRRARHLADEAPHRAVRRVPARVVLAGGQVAGVTVECDYPPEARTRTIVSTPLRPDGLSPQEIDGYVRARLAAGEDLYHLDEGALAQLARRDAGAARANRRSLALDMAPRLGGRIRRDQSTDNGLVLFVSNDNLRKGAASNAVEIAEVLVERGWIRKGSERRAAVAAGGSPA